MEKWKNGKMEKWKKLEMYQKLNKIKDYNQLYIFLVTWRHQLRFGLFVTLVSTCAHL